MITAAVSSVIAVSMAAVSLRAMKSTLKGVRGKRAPVKTVLDGCDPGPSGEPARDPQRVLVGLGAAVHEEHMIKARRRESCQCFSGLGADAKRYSVALKQQRPRLFLQCCKHGGVRVTERGHRVPAVEVDDATLATVQIHALCAVQLDWQLPVNLDQVPCLQFPRRNLRLAHDLAPADGGRCQTVVLGETELAIHPLDRPTGRAFH
jgi:hypothetical protein